MCGKNGKWFCQKGKFLHITILCSLAAIANYILPLFYSHNFFYIRNLIKNSALKIEPDEKNHPAI